MTPPEDKVPEKTERNPEQAFVWRAGDVVVISEGEDEPESKEEPDGTQ